MSPYSSLPGLLLRKTCKHVGGTQHLPVPSLLACSHCCIFNTRKQGSWEKGEHSSKGLCYTCTGGMTVATCSHAIQTHIYSYYSRGNHLQLCLRGKSGTVRTCFISHEKMHIFYSLRGDFKRVQKHSSLCKGLVST